MQLLPHESVSPPLWAYGRPVLVAYGPHLLGDAFVCGHGLEDLGGRHRALRVHVAPPVDCLDATLQGEAAMLPQHVPELGVRALDGVVGGREGPEPCDQVRVDVGEERVLPHERGEGVPSLDQPLVGEEGFALVVRGLFP